MSPIFDALFKSVTSAPLALDLSQRAIAPYLAIVTRHGDDRLIKVSSPTVPELETHWLRRLVIFPGFDPPLPPVGSTVVVFSIDGDPLNGWYVQCVNATNPPLDKGDQALDLASLVRGDQTETTEKNRTITVEGTLTLRTSGGASVTLSGNSITFSCGSASIQGAQIATVGAVDSRSDTLNTRGWQ